jgi:hypothetical protein
MMVAELFSAGRVGIQVVKYLWEWGRKRSNAGDGSGRGPRT